MHKIILNKTRKHNNRFTLVIAEEGESGIGMGGSNDPDYYPTHDYCVIRGFMGYHGYKEYMSVTLFLLRPDVPQEAKDELVVALRYRVWFWKYLKEIGYKKPAWKI